MDNIEKLLKRGVDEIIVEDHLKKELESGRKLRVKLGIDPTSPDLHLGHTVVLRKLKQFQELGHKIVLIIGDFTGQIGDPSGRSESRVPLSENEIKGHMKDYLDQAGKVIDVKKTEVRYNSEWHEKDGLKKMLELMRSATVQQILKREDFQKRLSEDAEISLLETVYPLLQGYDSVAIKADIELGGTDQKFNLLVGRRVQRHFGMAEQDIMTVPLIEGTDGVKKMSKSYGNYIGLNDEPNDMFGKIMAIPDVLIEKYFTYLTDIDQPKDLGPYESKMLLAETIVEMYHLKKSKKAKEEFINAFSKNEIPANIPELKVKNKEINIIDLLIQSGVESRSEARRLVEQGAIEIGGEIKRDYKEDLILAGGEILKRGKRNFFRIS